MRERCWRFFGRQWRPAIRVEASAVRIGFFIHLLDSSLPLHLAHLVFDLNTEIGGDAPEIGHSLAKAPGHLRKLFRPQNDQGDQKDDYEMGNAEHLLWSRLWVTNPNSASERRTNRHIDSDVPRSKEALRLHHRRASEGCQIGEIKRAILCAESEGGMKGERRGALLVLGVLALSAVLGGIYGPSVRATASGTTDLQDSIKNFTSVLSIVQQEYAHSRRHRSRSLRRRHPWNAARARPSLNVF